MRSENAFVGLYEHIPLGCRWANLRVCVCPQYPKIQLSLESMPLCEISGLLQKAARPLAPSPSPPPPSFPLLFINVLLGCTAYLQALVMSPDPSHASTQARKEGGVFHESQVNKLSG